MMETCFVCSKPATVIITLFDEEKPCCSRHGYNFVQNMSVVAV